MSALKASLDDAYRHARKLGEALTVAFHDEETGAQTRRDLAVMYEDADDLASRISNLANTLRELTP